MDMIGDSLWKNIIEWTEQFIGVPMSALRHHPIPVFTREREVGHPLVIIRSEDGSALAARRDLCDAVRPIVDELHADLLFSPFGVYELARATLPLGITIWGPTFFLFGDADTVKANDDVRVRRVGGEELGAVDYDIFWHCQRDAPAGFAVYEDGELSALATVVDRGGPVWEIGMETHPHAQGRGLGRAVVSAAANWILQNGKVPFATVGTFNVPSARTLRSVGLRYAFMTMDGRPGPFMVPPQTLGSPRPGETLYNYYPDWAMTKGILPRP